MWYDAIDATAIVSGAQVQTFLYFRRNPLWMLDDRTIEVCDIKSAVRPRTYIDRPTPGVPGSKEFTIFLDTLCCKNRAARHNAAAVN
ncbi:hypothetical protein HRbin36_02857 [bacterium HR36]|nr:hypothetical protein HRbin36_02857 [bacterium HR36]